MPGQRSGFDSKTPAAFFKLSALQLLFVAAHTHDQAEISHDKKMTLATVLQR
jgi:hypothetical protein